jgi:predicted secreted protein
LRTFGRDTTRIHVRVGERFALELGAAATAGFKWMLRQVPEVAALTEERIRPGGPHLGASSIQEFEFTAQRIGTSPLLLEYKRPWESGEGKRLTIEVVVDP